MAGECVGVCALLYVCVSLYVCCLAPSCLIAHNTHTSHTNAHLHSFPQAAGTQAAALPPQQESAALQRYRAQIWQQQRQVSLMGAELKVCVCISLRLCACVRVNAC